MKMRRHRIFGRIFYYYILILWKLSELKSAQKKHKFVKNQEFMNDMAFNWIRVDCIIMKW